VIYARFGIPLYLIIDPLKGECLLYLHPRGENYAGPYTGSAGLSSSPTPSI
jgi:Uma2 family endonuclease